MCTKHFVQSFEHCELYKKVYVFEELTAYWAVKKNKWIRKTLEQD